MFASFPDENMTMQLYNRTLEHNKMEILKLCTENFDKRDRGTKA